MEKIYLIETKYGHTLRWRFEEQQKYVTIFNLETREPIESVDVRYRVQFDFAEFCKSYIKKRFGQNLKAFYVEG